MIEEDGDYIWITKTEYEELQDLRAELHAEQIKTQHLEERIRRYEQEIDLEWAEENFIEKWKYNKLWKIIDLMAYQLSKRPLIIFRDGIKLEVLEDEDKIIEYYTKKVEEDEQ